MKRAIRWENAAAARETRRVPGRTRGAQDGDWLLRAAPARAKYLSAQLVAVHLPSDKTRHCRWTPRRFLPGCRAAARFDPQYRREGRPTPSWLTGSGRGEAC